MASQTLFLDSDNEVDGEQEEEVFLIGKVLSAPRKGASEEFKVTWDQSSLPFSMTKYKLRSYVDRSDHDKVSFLQTARSYFDDKYSEGNLTAVLHSLTNKNISKYKKSKRNTNQVSRVSSAKKAQKSSDKQSNSST